MKFTYILYDREMKEIDRRIFDNEITRLGNVISRGGILYLYATTLTVFCEKFAVYVEMKVSTIPV